MKKIPRVGWIWTINPGVTFYRMFQFINWLSITGLVHSYLFPDWEPRRLYSPNWEAELNTYMDTFVGIVEDCDMIVLQYVSTPAGIALLQAMKEFKPVFMEIDDMVSAVPAYSCAYDSNRPGDRQDYWATVQMMESTGIVCSTDFLRQYCQKYNQKVFTIPNCIDFQLWDQKERPKNDRVRIGWVGGATHEGDLKLVKEVLYEILEKYENVEIVICTAPPPEWPKHERMHLMNRWVTVDKYHELVKELNFDIGIAPLRDNLFNRAKSNLRYLEFSALKIPTVASDVEPFRKDFMGLRCQNEDDWFRSLAMLIESPEERERNGIASYELVKNLYSLERVALRYYGLIMETIGWELPSQHALQESNGLFQA